MEKVITVSSYFSPVSSLVDKALASLNTELAKKYKYDKRVENSKKLRLKSRRKKH